MSVHNIAPNVDRRWVSIGIGAVATTLALLIDLQGYQSFFFLVGSRLRAPRCVMIVDWFVVSRGDWDLSGRSPLRPAMLASWFCGFVAYQLVNPGTVNGWSDVWIWVSGQIGFVAPGGWQPHGSR